MIASSMTLATSSGSPPKRASGPSYTPLVDFATLALNAA